MYKRRKRQKNRFFFYLVIDYKVDKWYINYAGVIPAAYQKARRVYGLRKTRHYETDKQKKKRNGANKMYTFKNVANLVGAGTLTANEGLTLDITMSYLSTWEPESETGFTDLIALELADMVGQDIKVVRGYIGSLIKKGFLEIEEVDINFDTHLFIAITDKTRALYYKEAEEMNVNVNDLMEALDAKIEAAKEAEAGAEVEALASELEVAFDKLVENDFKSVAEEEEAGGASKDDNDKSYGKYKVTFKRLQKESEDENGYYTIWEEREFLAEEEELFSQLRALYEDDGVKDVNYEMILPPKIDVMVFKAEEEAPIITRMYNTLEALQQAVDGYLEVIPLGAGVLLICNEEGQIRQLTPNRVIGTNLIRGNFILVGQAGGEFISLTPEQIDIIQKKLI